MNSRRLLCSPKAKDHTLPRRGEKGVVHHSILAHPRHPGWLPFDKFSKLLRDMTAFVLNRLYTTNADPFR
jgi:hypothetical protein